MKHILSLSFILVLMHCGNLLYAQTMVNNPVYNSTTWTAAGSPYIITSNIVVFEGATLTIEPGAVVKFADGVTVDFRGKLLANGTQASPITFTSNNPNPAMGIYGGFKVTGYVGHVGDITNQLILSYCNVSYAKSFVDLGMSAQGPFTFTNCNFSNNHWVDENSADFGDLIFDHCTFTSNYQGVNWDGDGDVYVKNCIFTNNTIGAIAMYVTNSTFSGNTQYAVYAYQTLENCEIFNNTLGARWDAHASTTMTGNYIHDNAVGVEISRFWNEAGIVFSYNKICHNTTWNVQYDFSFNADLLQNCWCSLDSAYIRSTIRDGYVNTAYGLVSYSFNDTTCIPGNNNNNNNSSNNNNSNNNTPITVSASPNPFNNYSVIQFDYCDFCSYQLVIVNELGRTVRTYNNISGGSLTVEKNELPTGLYFYHLNSSNNIVAKGKLLIQ